MFVSCNYKMKTSRWG